MYIIIYYILYLYIVLDYARMNSCLAYTAFRPVLVAAAHHCLAEPAAPSRTVHLSLRHQLLTYFRLRFQTITAFQFQSRTLFKTYRYRINIINKYVNISTEGPSGLGLVLQITPPTLL